MGAMRSFQQIMGNYIWGVPEWSSDFSESLSQRGACGIAAGLLIQVYTSPSLSGHLYLHACPLLIHLWIALLHVKGPCATSCARCGVM